MNESHKFDIFDAVVSIFLWIMFIMEVKNNPQNLIKFGLFITLSMIVWMIIRVVGDALL